MSSLQAEKKAIEVKIAVESMVRCGGSCSGCMLTAEERRKMEFWRPEVMEPTGAFIKAMIEDRISRHGWDNLDSISLLCGQGDHFLLDDATIRDYVAWMRRAGGGYAAAVVSASAVASTDSVIRAVDAFYESSIENEQPLLIQVVFDPMKTMVENFKDTYASNMSYIRKRFGTIDLGINLGPDLIRSVTPRQMQEFVLRNGMVHAEINLFPTLSTAESFSRCWGEIIDWVLEFHEIWPMDGSYEIVYGYVLSRLIHDNVGVELSGLVDIVANRFAEEVYIDHFGNVCFMQAGALGNVVPFTSRFGEPLTAGNARLQETTELLERLPGMARKSASKVVSTFMRDKECASCRFMPVCSSGGFALQKRVLGDGGKAGCPLEVTKLFEHIEATNKANGKFHSMFPLDAVQDGFSSDRFRAKGTHANLDADGDIAF